MNKIKILNGREFRVIKHTQLVPEMDPKLFPSGYLPQVKKHFWKFSWWATLSSSYFDTRKEAWNAIHLKSKTQREFRVIPKWLPVCGSDYCQKIYMPQVRKHFLFFSWWENFYPSNSEYAETEKKAWNMVDLRIIEEQLQREVKGRDRKMFTNVVRK